MIEQSINDVINILIELKKHGEGCHLGFGGMTIKDIKALDKAIIICQYVLDCKKEVEKNK